VHKKWKMQRSRNRTVLEIISLSNYCTKGWSCWTLLTQCSMWLHFPAMNNLTVFKTVRLLDHWTVCVLCVFMQQIIPISYTKLSISKNRYSQISISVEHEKILRTSVVAVPRWAFLINLADLQTQAALFHMSILHLKAHLASFSQTNHIISNVHIFFTS